MNVFLYFRNDHDQSLHILNSQNDQTMDKTVLIIGFAL